MGDSTIQVAQKVQQTTPSSATLIAFSFVLAYILSSFPIMLLTLFITDMAQMFGIEVGMMGVVVDGIFLSLRGLFWLALAALLFIAGLITIGIVAGVGFLLLS